MVERMNAFVSRVSAWMRASSVLKGSRGFNSESAVLPALFYQATLDALRVFDPEFSHVSTIGNSKPDRIQVVFATSEADSDTALIAERLGACVLGLDSDYLILCGRGQGCRYIPFDTVSWVIQLATQPKEEQVEQKEEDDDGFSTVVKKGKGKKQNRQTLQAVTERTSFTPTLEPGEQVLRFTGRSYSSQALAHILGIPPSLFPLLAALLGNDYCDYAKVLFTRGMLPTERINVAAAAIREEWEAQQSKQAPKSSGGGASGTSTPTQSTMLVSPVHRLVDATIRRLLSAAENQTALLSDESDFSSMLETIIDSIVAYGKSATSHRPEDKPLSDFFNSQGGAEGLTALDQADPLVAKQIEQRRRALEVYRTSFFQGRFSRELLSVMVYRHYFSHLGLEDTTKKSCTVTYGRPIRSWIYAILFSNYGLRWARTRQEVEAEEKQEQEALAAKEMEDDYLDEVISVATSVSSEDEAETGDTMLHSALLVDSKKPDAYVWEEVRRGDKVSCEPVQIESVAALVAQTEAPVSAKVQSLLEADGSAVVGLWPFEARQELFYHALDAGSVANVPSAYRPVVAVLRFMIRASFEAAPTPNRSATEWMRMSDVEAVILTAILAYSNLSLEADGPPKRAMIELTDRNIHMSTAYQTSLAAAHFLAEALSLLSDQDEKLEFAPHRFYDGPTFHLLMGNMKDMKDVATSKLSDADLALVDNLKQAVLENYEKYLFVGGATKAERKALKKQKAAPPPAPVAKRNQTGFGGFAILGDEED